MIYDTIFRDLCRRMVQRGYYDYARALCREGRQTREGEEDLALPKGLLVYCRDFEHSQLNNCIEDDISWLTMTGTLDEHLEEMLKTLDGANIVDGERISYPVVFDCLGKAREAFNAARGTSYGRFSHVVPLLIPPNFTYNEGGQIKMGSKSKTALAIALLGKKDEAVSYLSKTTVFNSTGTGKVTRMQLREDGTFGYDEFYLFRDSEMDARDPLREAVTRDAYFDDGVIGLMQSFGAETQDPSSVPRRLKQHLVTPAELFKEELAHVF